MQSALLRLTATVWVAPVPQHTDARAFRVPFKLLTWPRMPTALESGVEESLVLCCELLCLQRLFDCNTSGFRNVNRCTSSHFKPARTRMRTHTGAYVHEHFTHAQNSDMHTSHVAAHPPAPIRKITCLVTKQFSLRIRYQTHRLPTGLQSCGKPGRRARAQPAHEPI